MKQISVNVYSFDELSDAAKKIAREWMRVGKTEYFDTEFVIDDAKTMFGFCGFSIDKIYYSGFSCQGDGACFTGTWSAENVKAAELRDNAPVDQILHRLVDEFGAFAVKYPEATATLEHHGHYSHERSVDITVNFGATYNEAYEHLSTMAEIEPELVKMDKIENEFKSLARDCMKWVYEQIEEDYHYQLADEQIDDCIKSNDYSFTADGKVWNE